MLDPQVSPEENKEQGGGAGIDSWTSSASVVSQQRGYGHCLL